MIVESKYTRTVMRTEANDYVQARINMQTGEIKPYKYPVPSRPRKPVAKANTEGLEPFWLSAEVVEQAEPRSTTVESAKAVENPYFGMLDIYDVYEIRSGGIGQIVCASGELDEDQLDDAICSLADNLPYMDDYFTGVAQLGTHHPLSKNVMFYLLRSLPTISSKTIFQATSYTIGYCQRLATALRIFIKLTT